MHTDVMHAKQVKTKLLTIKKKEKNMEILSCPYLPCKFHCEQPSLLTSHRKSVHESNAMDNREMCPTYGITLEKNTSLPTHIRNLHTGPVQCTEYINAQSVLRQPEIYHL